MFIENKYTSCYYRIVRRAQLENRRKGCGQYYERHHIIPYCKPFCGTNANENLVLLTGREHFLAHWLLVKMTEGDRQLKMKHALWKMTHKTGGRIVSSWQYQIAKTAQASAIKTRIVSDETREKISKATKGKKRNSLTPEHKMALKEAAKKRKPITEETRKKRSESLKGRIPWNKGMPSERKGVPSGFHHTEEHKKKMSDSQKGKTLSEEHKAKIRATKQAKSKRND